MTETKYKLYRKVDNEWCYWGIFTDVNKLIKVVYNFGTLKLAEDIKVEVEMYET